MNNVPTNLSLEVLKPINKGFEVMFPSSNATPLLQAIDQSVIENLNRMYRTHVLCMKGNVPFAKT